MTLDPRVLHFKKGMTLVYNGRGCLCSCLYHVWHNFWHNLANSTWSIVYLKYPAGSCLKGMFYPFSALFTSPVVLANTVD